MQKHFSLNASAHTTLSTPRQTEQSFTNTATDTCGSIDFGPPKCHKPAALTEVTFSSQIMPTSSVMSI